MSTNFSLKCSKLQKLRSSKIHNKTKAKLVYEFHYKFLNFRNISVKSYLKSVLEVTAASEVLRVVTIHYLLL